MTHPGKLLKEKNIFAKKALGQNFLSDTSVAEMIVSRANITATDTVLEIGPGLGALTVPAAAKAEKVFAVEKDNSLVAPLNETIRKSGQNNIEVICADILDIDIESLAGPNNIVIIGNLPYNISSQILFRLVEKRHVITSACLMFQKELAVRISALPGEKEYSRISAVMQHCSEITAVGDVSPHLFFPKPAVTSRILLLSFFDSPDVPREKETYLFRVIKAAFSRRRKKLKNALAGEELEIDRDTAEKALVSAGIDPGRRGESLNISEFRILSEEIFKISNNNSPKAGPKKQTDIEAVER